MALGPIGEGAKDAAPDLIQLLQDDQYGWVRGAAAIARQEKGQQAL